MSDFVSTKYLYHYAAKNCLVSILKEANKYDLKQRDDYGRVPIHYASWKGHLKALQAILSLGGKVDKCDFFGNSVLHYAIRSQNLNCVSFLINYEPKLIWFMDNNNLTAKDLAELLEYSEIYKQLDEFHNMQLKSMCAKLFKFQIQQIENAEKRRKKYEKKMENSAKVQIEEYKKKMLFRFEFKSKIYSAFDKVKLDDNVILSSTSKTNSKSNLTFKLNESDSLYLSDRTSFA